MRAKAEKAFDEVMNTYLKEVDDERKHTMKQSFMALLR